MDASRFFTFATVVEFGCPVHGCAGFPRRTVYIWEGCHAKYFAETFIVLTCWGFVSVGICMADVHGTHAWPMCTVQDVLRSASATEICPNVV